MRIGPSGYLLLLRARNRMDREFAVPLSVAELARTAGCSTSHFIRSFRSAFGETPHAYLRRRRVERAKELLRATDASVTEVCFAAGFGSLGSFSAAFKEVTGHSPTGYRSTTAVRPEIPACFVLNWTRPTGIGQFSRSAAAPVAGSVATQPTPDGSDR